MDLTKAFCGSSPQKPLHPFQEENQCIRERGLQRRHSGQCDFSSKDNYTIKLKGNMGTRFKFFSCSFLIILPEYVKVLW